MNAPSPAGPLARVLPDLESAVRFLRARDLPSGAATLDRVGRSLRSGGLDPGDRMILGKVLLRLRKASEGVLGAQALLRGIESLSTPPAAP